MGARGRRAEVGKEPARGAQQSGGELDAALAIAMRMLADAARGGTTSLAHVVGAWVSASGQMLSAAREHLLQQRRVAKASRVEVLKRLVQSLEQEAREAAASDVGALSLRLLRRSEQLLAQRLSVMNHY